MDRRDGERGRTDRVTLGEQVRPRSALDPVARADLPRRLSARAGRNPLDELRAQNRELVAALEELNARSRRAGSGSTPSWRRPTAASWRCTRSCPTSWSDQPGRRRAVRRARRQAPASSRGQRVQDPLPQQRQPRAAHPGELRLGLARLLLDPAAEPLTAEQRHQVELILASGEDLLRLVNELLDLAKAESGRLEAVVDRGRPRPTSSTSCGARPPRS